MITQATISLYREARKAGYGASSALRAARILRKWRALSDVGAVRIIAEVDTDFEPTDFIVSDDTEAFGTIGQYRSDLDSRERWESTRDSLSYYWKTGDSVWGHVGYRDVLDWRENVYIVDIMDSTIDAFRDAWKAHVHNRCPACGHSA